MAALPMPKAFWPYTVTAGASDRVEFSVAAGPRTATVAPGVYYSAQALMDAVASAVTAAHVAAGGGGSFAGSTTTAGRSRLLCPVDATFYFGRSGSIGPRLGFTGDTASAALYVTSQTQHVNGWYPETPVVDDSMDLSLYERSIAKAIGGQTSSLDHGATVQRFLSFAFLPAWKTWKAEEVAKANESLERLFENGWARFRYWPDAAVESAYADYQLDPETAKSLPRNRLSPGTPLYSLTLKLWKYVAP